MYVEAMGVLHGVFFSQFNAARDRKAMERLRPPPGGPLDATVYEVMLQAKHVQLNTATTRYGQDPRALEALPAPAKHLVRIVGEDLSLDFRSGLRRPGSVEGGDVSLRLSVQGCAAKDEYSGQADAYLWHLKKMRAHNGGEPLHVEFSATQLATPGAIARLTAIEVNNALKVCWAPESVAQLVRVFNRGVDRLYTPLKSADEGAPPSLSAPIFEPLPQSAGRAGSRSPSRRSQSPHRRPGSGGRSRPRSPSHATMVEGRNPTPRAKEQNLLELTSY